MEQLANTENGDHVGDDLAGVAIRQVVSLGDTAPGLDEQSQTNADWAAEAISSPDHTQPVPGGEPVTERPGQRGESDRRTLANVYADPKRHTVTLLLDDVTANMVIYAVRLLAADSEAHAREVQLVRATMPPDSYGAANRLLIALRHERVAGRLRVLERNYREITTLFGA